MIELNRNLFNTDIKHTYEVQTWVARNNTIWNDTQQWWVWHCRAPRTFGQWRLPHTVGTSSRSTDRTPNGYCLWAPKCDATPLYISRILLLLWSSNVHTSPEIIFLKITWIVCEYTNIIYFKTNLIYSYPTQTRVMLFNATECCYTVRGNVHNLRLARWWRQSVAKQYVSFSWKVLAA